MTALPVVVIEGSATHRRFLRLALEVDGEFEVVGEALTAREAVPLVARLRPAAVLLDLDPPGDGALEAIELIMARSPTPILVCSACPQGAGRANAVAALAAGAVDVLAKPACDDPAGLGNHAGALRAGMRVAVRIRVITHPRARLRTAARPVGAQPATPAVPTPHRGVRLIALGASTGGPQALATVLSGLPADLAQPVLVVQHMAESFVPGLADWLDSLVPMRVVVGQSGRRLQPGTVTLAPGGGNLLVQDDRLRVLGRPPRPGQFHVPGIDETFHSIADTLGPNAIGIVLTGMGRDGALGLTAMRERGAPTIGQDEATSAVYGMPAAAHAAGAVAAQLPVGEIAKALLALVGHEP